MKCDAVVWTHFFKKSEPKMNLNLKKNQISPVDVRLGLLV